METKLFRNFTVFINRAPNPVTLKEMKIFELWPSEDPTGSQWTTGGFLPITDGAEPEYRIDVQGAALLALIQVNERILPGSVQREKVIERIADIERRDGRKANKKDYAQVKDEVCMELLPKAFLRRKLIPIMFMSLAPYGQAVVIFTSSAKKADDVIVSLTAAFSDYKDCWEPALMENIIVKTPGQVLTAIAKGDVIDGGDYTIPDADSSLVYGNQAVLKGQGKQTIRIKDKDMGAADMQELLKQAYDVSKLGLDFFDGELDPSAEFVLSDKLVFTTLKVDAVSKERTDSEEDSSAMFINNTWLIARQLKSILHLVIAGMGGFRETPDDDPGEIGSHVAPAKNESGISVAAQSIINDPLQQTDPFTEFASADDEDEL